MCRRTDSDIFRSHNEKYLSKPIIGEAEEEQFRKMLSKKSKLVGWFVSHCDTDNKREDYVKELAKHVQVDVYGKCGTKKCDHVIKCNAMLKNDYKFYLAFENTLCRDYITEKFYKSLGFYELVPIVFGGANYSEFAPPHSFIDIRQFETPKHLADYLIYLDGNQTAYEEYFYWRTQWAAKSTEGWCKLCEMLNNPSLPSKTYDDIYNWWVDQGDCANQLPVNIKTLQPDLAYTWSKIE